MNNSFLPPVAKTVIIILVLVLLLFSVCYLFVFSSVKKSLNRLVFFYFCPFFVLMLFSIKHLCSQTSVSVGKPVAVSCSCLVVPSNKCNYYLSILVSLYAFFVLVLCKNFVYAHNHLF